MHRTRNVSGQIGVTLLAAVGLFTWAVSIVLHTCPALLVDLRLTDTILRALAQLR